MTHLMNDRVVPAGAVSFSPVRRWQSTVTRRSTVEVAGHTIVRRLLGELRQHEASSHAGKEAEALHHFRVSVRRLRAAVRVFAPAFASRVHRRLSEDLTWLRRLAGAVRDLDVQLDRLHHEARRLPAAYRSAVAGLRNHLEEERARLRREFVQGLDSSRYARLLSTLDEFTAAPVPSHVGGASRRQLFSHAGAADQHCLVFQQAWRRFTRPDVRRNFRRLAQRLRRDQPSAPRIDSVDKREAHPPRRSSGQASRRSQKKGERISPLDNNNRSP